MKGYKIIDRYLRSKSILEDLRIRRKELQKDINNIDLAIESELEKLHEIVVNYTDLIYAVEQEYKGE